MNTYERRSRRPSLCRYVGLGHDNEKVGDAGRLCPYLGAAQGAGRVRCEVAQRERVFDEVRVGTRPKSR